MEYQSGKKNHPPDETELEFFHGIPISFMGLYANGNNVSKFSFIFPYFCPKYPENCVFPMISFIIRDPSLSFGRLLMRLIWGKPPIEKVI